MKTRFLTPNSFPFIYFWYFGYSIIFLCGHHAARCSLTVPSPFSSFHALSLRFSSFHSFRAFRKGTAPSQPLVSLLLLSTLASGKRGKGPRGRGKEPKRNRESAWRERPEGTGPKGSDKRNNPWSISWNEYFCFILSGFNLSCCGFPSLCRFPENRKQVIKRKRKGTGPVPSGRALQRDKGKRKNNSNKIFPQ